VRLGPETMEEKPMLSVTNSFSFEVPVVLQFITMYHT
jgi:hypothetical protein